MRSVQSKIGMGRDILGIGTCVFGENTEDGGGTMTSSPERLRAYRKEYYLENRIELLSKARRAAWFYRSLAIENYGNVCSRCGYTDVRALQFNHLNGGGRKENRRSYSFIRALATGPKRDDINLLCANCNCLYDYERGYRTGPPNVGGEKTQ